MKTSLRTSLVGVVAALVLLAGGVLRAEDIQLLSLKDPIEDPSLMFPRDVSTVLFTRSLKHLPAAGEQEIRMVDLMRIIDTDRASYYELVAAQDLTFWMSLNALQRVNHITVTGWNLEGTTVDVKYTTEPISPDEKGWKTLVEGVRLDSPCTAIRFSPTTVMQAIVTFHTPASDGKPTRVCDLAMISQQDLRDFRIERRPEARTRSPIAHNSALSWNSMPFERQPNLSGMGTGARVLYMSRGADFEQAFLVNDDDPKTSCNFSGNGSESVAIFDMTESRRVRKACLVHNRTPGEVSGYVVNHLPWLGDEDEAASADANGNGNGNGNGKTASKKKSKTLPPMVNIPSSWFAELHKLGGGRTDEVEFTQMEAPVIECRYFIVRHTRAVAPQTAKRPVWLRPMAWWFAGVAASDVMPVALGSGEAPPFTLYDVNVFGDYPPEDWEVAPYDREASLTVSGASPSFLPTSTPKDPELFTPPSPP
ncbi:MAG: hypothetical protein IT578_04315 [Verrucomicrobiae bacterium]|nr:hypothetical protein [Verrucomicrobiae bacterium]